VFITDLDADDERRQGQAANLLLLGFAREWPNAWPTVESAVAEVTESLGEDRISRVAISETSELSNASQGIFRAPEARQNRHHRPTLVRQSFPGDGLLGRAKAVGNLLE
jgi:hypothetical protein